MRWPARLPPLCSSGRFSYHPCPTRPGHATHLLEHMPPQMHLVLLTRTDPACALARLRARNQLLEIRRRPTPLYAAGNRPLSERRAGGLKLSSNDIAALEARTEGWIAGCNWHRLRLQGNRFAGAHCDAGHQDVHGFVSAFTGSHSYIMDYLGRRGAQAQTEIPYRSFLLQSSILGRMCGSSV